MSDSSIDRSDALRARDISIRGGTTGLLVMLLGVVALWLHIIRQPLLHLLGVVPDDAFYYLGIARHVAATGVSTFDGVNATNGYHPAWMALCTLFALIAHDREILLRTVLLVSLLFHIGTSMLVARVLGMMIGRGWGRLGGALWLMSPFPLLLHLQGVETPLYMLALAFALLLYLRAIDPYLARDGVDDATRRRNAIPGSRLALFGCALGGVVLCRTEGIILAIVSTLYLMIGLWRSGTRSPLPLLRVALIVGGTALLVAAPWFIYSYATIGQVGQDSGAMKMLWAAAEHAALTPFKRANEVGAYLYQSWLGKPVELMLWTPHAVRKIVPALLAGAIAWWIYRYRRVADPRLVRITIWLVSASFITGLVYGILLTDSQIWHFGEPGLVVYLLAFAWGVTALRHSRPRRMLRNPEHVAAALRAIAAGLLLLFTFGTIDLYPWQRDVFTSQQRFERMIPSDATIGCFNAGIPGYFSERRVIGLDGLVNHAAVRYWRERRFEDYLRDAGIACIIDEEDALRRARDFSSSPIKLVPLDSAELTGWRSKYRRVWRVER